MQICILELLVCNIKLKIMLVFTKLREVSLRCVQFTKDISC